MAVGLMMRSSMPATSMVRQLRWRRHWHAEAASPAAPILSNPTPHTTFASNALTNVLPPLRTVAELRSSVPTKAPEPPPVQPEDQSRSQYSEVNHVHASRSTISIGSGSSSSLLSSSSSSTSDMGLLTDRLGRHAGMPPDRCTSSGTSTTDQASMQAASGGSLPEGRRPKLPKGLSKLHLKVMHVIRAREMLKPDDSILLAVSGGQDSVCLAQLMTDLSRARAWRLQVAHCDHRWRADSEANAVHVAGLACKWGLPFHLRTAPDPPPSTEASARAWRYQTLADLALELGCNVVVTGHTATDRAETLLVNLVRGAGADGMQALAWSRPLAPGVSLVRPLLTVGRHQTLELCEQHGLPIWEDSTNSDNKYRRNRIRNELMPYLRQHFNPRADEALARTAEVLQDEVALLEEAAEKLLSSCLAGAAALESGVRRRSVLRLSASVGASEPVRDGSRASTSLSAYILELKDRRRVDSGSTEAGPSNAATTPATPGGSKATSATPSAFMAATMSGRGLAASSDEHLKSVASVVLFEAQLDYLATFLTPGSSHHEAVRALQDLKLPFTTPYTSSILSPPSPIEPSTIQYMLQEATATCTASAPATSRSRTDAGQPGSTAPVEAKATRTPLVQALGTAPGTVPAEALGVAREDELSGTPERRLLLVSELVAAPVALQRRALRQLMSRLVPNAALTHSAVEEVLQLLSNCGEGGGPAASTGSLPRGMRAWVEGRLLVLEAGSGRAWHADRRNDASA